MDPGSADMCGIVLFYLDWLQQTLVIEYAWAKPNRSTSEIAEVIRLAEQKLWGAKHRDPQGPRYQAPRELDMRAAMKPGAPWATTSEPEPLLDVANAERTEYGKLWEAPNGALTYWDDESHSLLPNPIERISDMGDPQARFDLHNDHGLAFSVTDKARKSDDTNLQRLRLLFTQRKIVILRNGYTDPLIQQLRSGMWNERRTDWKRTPTLGHLDCISALMYAERAANWKRNPFPPSIKDVYLPDVHYPDAYKQQVIPVVTPPRGDRGVYQPRHVIRGRR
jgi:hypothetical protein